MRKFVLLLAVSLVAVVPSMGQEDSLSVGKRTSMLSIYELGLKFPVTTITDDTLLLLRMDYDEDMVLEGGYDASFGVNGGEFVVSNAGYEPVTFHYRDVSGRMRGMFHNIRVNDWGYIVSADYYEWYGDDVDSVYVYAKGLDNPVHLNRDKYRHYYESSLQNCTTARLTMDYNADGRISMIACYMLVTENGRVEKEIIDSINFNWGDDGFLGNGGIVRPAMDDDAKPAVTVVNAGGEAPAAMKDVYYNYFPNTGIFEGIYVLDEVPAISSILPESIWYSGMLGKASKLLEILTPSYGFGKSIDDGIDRTKVQISYSREGCVSRWYDKRFAYLGTAANERLREAVAGGKTVEKTVEDIDYTPVKVYEACRRSLWLRTD